jgi:3-methyl-2-oxobutanoate hydroxymethyltransferase
VETDMSDDAAARTDNLLTDREHTPVLYGGVTSRRVTTLDLAKAKAAGERWPMLTAYDFTTARIFDQAGIPVLLVGDSAANVVYGYDTTVPISIDELLPLVRAVVRGTSRALVVADLPFGTYRSSPEQALATAIRFMKEGGAQAVKLEGGAEIAPHIRLLVQSGIPVMAHVGLTPQSVNTLGGYRVQGRGEGGDKLVDDAHAVVEAGAFSLVLEAVPADIAKELSHDLVVPVVGIGAGVETDAQVLVWQDMAGFAPDGGRTAKFVKQFAHLGSDLADAARRYAAEVRGGVFPAEEHTYR